MKNKNYPNLIKGSRPDKYDYETDQLIKNGYVHQYSIDFENPDSELVKKDLDENKQNYRIIIPEDRPRIRHFWIKV